VAWTYDTLSAAIQNYVQSHEGTLVTDMPIIVQQAEDRILKAVQLPDFRKNVTGTVTVSDPYLIMPTDFLSPYSMAVDNTGYEFLIFKEVSFVRQAYPDVTVTSVPKYYAIFSSEYFLVGPTPDQNYDIELHYFYKPESIVTAGTSWLGDNAESTLLYGCLVEAYTYTKGEEDMVKTVNIRYTEALDKLKLLGEGRNATDSYRNG
jgi:hypothetical protein